MEVIRCRFYNWIEVMYEYVGHKICFAGIAYVCELQLPWERDLSCFLILSLCIKPLHNYCSVLPNFFAIYGSIYSTNCLWNVFAQYAI